MVGDIVSLVFDWSALHPLTTGSGTGGVLRRQPEDFVVQEVPLYALAGEGEHLFAEVRKTGHTTAHVIRLLAAELGVRERDIGVAGLKDRHAVTTQWLSLPGKVERRLEALALEGVEVVQVTRHTNKLGMGHLSGNRFEIRVREAGGSTDQAREVMATLAAQGVPNYFGPQRFGLGGVNAEEGLRVLRGESRVKDPRVRRFLTSSVQSMVFNRFLSLRLERGVFSSLLRGDMAKKHDTGGVFQVEDPLTEGERAARGEVSATGTLFGKKVRPLNFEAGALEAEALAAFGLEAGAFASRRGDRRLTRVFLDEGSVTAEDDGFRVAFNLPRGSFATSVLREIMKTNVDTLAPADQDDDAEGDE
ncbi:tRNA pseudouridine(13) synthase TruD [Deinococcus sp. KSM4-11]|uniref:tRNA pseudouridine(13) synthase TruD n=1 Tax=Deinococcus sp. KSM4-11 TaxID=2568654 RepID=UPI0010A3D602|nr:tRNA pseudouridine(13) synthase TruD [Deinococcus sp. KSM4-11]THF87981.1 tRNA pseudouridine(13) synthase TruD [Deinococcus sp. KSM4-11]